METVTVALSSPWPTLLGLRRPQEGLIQLPAADADAVVAAGAGQIVPASETPTDSAPTTRSTRRARSKPAPSPAAETPDASEAE